MLKFLLIFLTLLSITLGKRIQFPIVGDVKEDCFLHTYFQKITVGTPAQEVGDVWLVDQYTDFYVHDKRTYNYGFDPDKSSSFVKIGDSYGKDRTKNGINGTDNFNFNGSILKGKPIKVLSNYLGITPKTIIGIARSDDGNCFDKSSGCTSFLQSVLRDEKEQVVVFAFDNVKRDCNHNLTGQLVIGETPKDLCKNWFFMPEIPVKGGQWHFYVDRITIDKYSFVIPVKTTITFDEIDNQLWLARNVYDQVMQVLRADADKRIDCDTKTNIVFKMGNKDFSIPPELYIKKEIYPNNRCDVLIQRSGNSIIFPWTYFTNKCVMYDYGKLQIGIADRV